MESGGALISRNPHCWQCRAETSNSRCRSTRITRTTLFTGFCCSEPHLRHAISGALQGALGRTHVYSLRTLLALFAVELHCLSFFQRLKAVTLNRAVVNKQIFAAVVRSNKSVAL